MEEESEGSEAVYGGSEEVEGKFRNEDEEGLQKRVFDQHQDKGGGCVGVGKSWDNEEQAESYWWRTKRKRNKSKKLKGRTRSSRRVGPYEVVRDKLQSLIKSKNHRTVKGKAPLHPPR